MFELEEIKRMNADKAREMSRRKPEVPSLLKRVYALIESAAKQHKTEVVDPLAVRQNVTEEEAKAVYSDLREQGYIVMFDNNPRGRAVIVSWDKPAKRRAPAVSGDGNTGGGKHVE